MKYEPEDDGLTHINIYSRGKTELGRLLSNFAHTPIVIPGYGYFQSVEGFWYWLLILMLGIETPRIRELRDVWGFEAKKLGRELIAQRNGEHSLPKNLELAFSVDILRALRIKLDTHEHIRQLLVESMLPFTHYYVIRGKQFPVERYLWLTEFWEIARRDYQRELFSQGDGFR